MNKNFLYFHKEIKNIFENSKTVNQTLKEFLFFKVDDDSKDYLEAVLIKINHQYMEILELIQSIFQKNFDGSGAKDILKYLLKKSSTEELLGIKQQPVNTCPLIDSAMKVNHIDRNGLELLRIECERVRSLVNCWKEQLWESTTLNFTIKGYFLYFHKIPTLDLQYNDFNFTNEESCKALQNYNNIIEWGLNYFKFVSDNHTIVL